MIDVSRRCSSDATDAKDDGRRGATPTFRNDGVAVVAAGARRGMAQTLWTAIPESDVQIVQGLPLAAVLQS